MWLWSMKGEFEVLFWGVELVNEKIPGHAGAA